MRAAILLVTDLAVLTLRRHLTVALGVDPLSVPGMTRWATEVPSIHRHGLGGAAPGTT